MNINDKCLTLYFFLALIDDELANTTKISKHTACDVKNYTIYEKWQKVEHALRGDELIYDLWKNWGEKGCGGEVQFRLKINKQGLENTNGQIKSKVIHNENEGKIQKKENQKSVFLEN
jgi:hypothetical protein